MGLVGEGGGGRGGGEAGVVVGGDGADGAGVGGDGPFDFVVADEGEAEDGAAFGVCSDFGDGGGAADEAAGEHDDVVVLTDVEGTGGKDFHVGGELADGSLVTQHFVRRNYGEGACAFAGGAVTPCQVADVAEHGGDVGGAAAEEEKAGHYGFGFFAQAVAGATAYLFAGIEEFGEAYFGGTGFHGGYHLFVADAGTELHGVPVERIGCEGLAYGEADVVGFLCSDRLRSDKR